MRGLWDWIKETAAHIGATPEVAQAVAIATASPTLPNIQRVQDAYRASGSTPPPELMSFLYDRYYQSIPYSIPPGTVQTAVNWAPWIAGGAVLLFALSRGRRR